MRLSPKSATLKHHALVGLRCNRKLGDGRTLTQLHKRGQQLRLLGLKFPVHLSWYYFKRSDGKLEKRYILSTKALKASTMNWWGRRRWQMMALLPLLAEIQRLRPLAKRHGLDINVAWCKM